VVGDQAGDYDIYGGVVAPNGTALSDEFLINQNTTEIQCGPSVAALNNGNVFVTWAGDQAGLPNIYGCVFSPNGTAFTNELLINQNTTGSQSYPSVAILSNGNALVTWYGDQA
jgi:hypothetical protein